jgi:hypothetical protein
MDPDNAKSVVDELIKEIQMAKPDAREQGLPDDWFNQICHALGLFDGARPASRQVILWQEVLPAIEALKANNPEAAVVVEENQRVHRLWIDALGRMADANRRCEGAIRRWEECEQDRQSLLRTVKSLRDVDKQSERPR